MKIFEDIQEYLDSGKQRMWTNIDEQSIFYKVAFWFLLPMVVASKWFYLLGVSITFTFWIVPWLIHREIKEKRGGRQ